MPYNIVQSDGFTAVYTPQAAITGYGGANRINHATLGTRNKVGRCLRVRGTATNDGNYSIIGQISPTQTDVAPAVTADPVAGTVQVCFDATTKQVATPVTAFPATPGQVTAAGANFANLFGTGLVQKNDRCYVIGSTSNDGAWWVDSVVDANNLIVRPLNGQPALVSEAVPGGTTIQVVQGCHELEILDEAAADLLQAWINNAVDPNFGSGVGGPGGDFIEYLWTGNFFGSPHARYAFLEGIGVVRIQQSGATATTLDLSDHSVISKQMAGDFCVFQSLGATALVSTIRLGRSQGTDRYGVSHSTALYGFVFGEDFDSQWASTKTRLKIESYGSLWRGRTSGRDTHPPGTIMRGSIFAGSQQVKSTAEIESHVEWTTNFGLIWGGAPDAANILFGDSNNLGGSFDPGVVIEGLLKSDAVASPMLTIFTGDVTLLNSREDYGLTGLIQGAAAKVRYTWNPRFVERDAAGVTGSPIGGLIVRVFDVRESTGGESQPYGASFTTISGGGSAGRINGGAGLDLLREDLTAGFYSQRITVEGAGYRAINMVITMRSKLDVDVPVDFLRPDLEEEGLST